jgi:sensor c-di-GMP phosphodiesterase-like protein
MTTTIKHPDISIDLVGEDGNAFAILGRCRRKMRHAGLPDEEIALFTTEATAGDYDNLLSTIVNWFSVNGL